MGVSKGFLLFSLLGLKKNKKQTTIKASLLKQPYTHLCLLTYPQVQQQAILQCRQLKPTSFCWYHNSHFLSVKRYKMLEIRKVSLYYIFIYIKLLLFVKDLFLLSELHCLDAIVAENTFKEQKHHQLEAVLCHNRPNASAFTDSAC